MNGIERRLFGFVPNLVETKGASEMNLERGTALAIQLTGMKRPDLNVSVGRKGVAVLGGNGQSFKVPSDLYPTQAAQRALEVFA